MKEKVKISCYKCAKLGVGCAAMRTPDEKCFLPRKRKIPNEETLQVFKDTDKGIGLVGPFETVEELFESLKS